MQPHQHRVWPNVQCGRLSVVQGPTAERWGAPELTPLGNDGFAPHSSGPNLNQFMNWLQYDPF